MVLDKDRAWFRLRLSVRVMYGVNSLRYGCAAEARSRSQKIMEKYVGRDI